MNKRLPKGRIRLLRVRLKKPLKASQTGRQANGRFLKGVWKGGPGNPYVRQVAALRSALLNAVTPDDIDAVIRALIKKALEGDVPAIRELLDRVLGRPVEVDFVERLKALEDALDREPKK